MARPNSIIAVGNTESRPDYDFADGVELHVFELASGKSASTVVRSKEGRPELEARVERREDVLYFTINGDKPYKLVLRGIGGIRRADGAIWEQTGSGTVVKPGTGIKKLEIRIG